MLVYAMGGWKKVFLASQIYGHILNSVRRNYLLCTEESCAPHMGSKICEDLCGRWKKSYNS